jgi:hypothetical protein
MSRAPVSHLRSTRSQRTGWDSNPRYGYPYTGFRDRLLQPLGHLSFGTRRLLGLVEIVNLCSS